MEKNLSPQKEILSTAELRSRTGETKVILAAMTIVQRHMQENASEIGTRRKADEAISEIRRQQRQLEERLADDEAELAWLEAAEASRV